MNKPSSLRSPQTKEPLAPTAPPSPVASDVLLVEGILFWDKYKVQILAAAVLFVVALVASEFYALARDRKMHAAGAELDGAKTPADYRHVIDTYPGSMAAANAMLLLGRQQMDAKDYPGAAGTWKDFATKFPGHSLAPIALLGAGGALEALGKPDEARSLYQRAATVYQNSFAAPLARLNEAALLEAEHKPDQARHIYENIMASAANSDAARQAEEELRFIRVAPSAPSSILPVPAASVAPTVAPATAAPH